MNIYICDDEPQMLLHISEQVHACLPESKITVFSDEKKLIHSLKESACDLLLLDIDLPKISGLDIAKLLSQVQKKPLLVFVTSHDELVYDSLQFHPFGFVRKSFLEAELAKILSDCAAELENCSECFHFHTPNAEIQLPLSEILYFESEGNYLRVFAVSGEYRFRDTLLAVQNALAGNGFIRLHRGFLVNQAAVRSLGADDVELINGIRIPIGRNYADSSKKQLMRYMMR